MANLDTFAEDVKPYARARMKAIGERTEHTDGFNFENIASTELNKRYHVELLESRELSNNQDHLMLEQPFYLRIFKSATGKPKDLIDAVKLEIRAILDEFLKPANRLTQAAIKNIRYDSDLIEKLNTSNDNGVIGRIQFTALVIRSTR